jgi:signal transduction histidine kinase
MSSAGEKSFDQLRKEHDDLAHQLKQSEAKISVLNQELAETNSGVIALYAELDDKAAQLRDVSELKSRFLSYMSHEFRTPLGSIRSLTRILLDKMDGPLAAEQERQIRFIQDSADELTQLVNDLLDLAKIEAGRITIAPAWFDMLDLFTALRGMFKPLVTSDSVSLIFEQPQQVLRLYTDDKKLSQILRNLISNALKFTQQGEVRVSVEYDSPGLVIFSVADTGIGIAKEHLGSLFQDFVQVDSPLQRRFRGTGLGLSLSMRLAQLLGGTITVQSEFGIGSRFSVTIPLYLNLEEAAAAGVVENPVPIKETKDVV